MPFDVIGIGDVVSDYVINLVEFPEPDSTQMMLSESWQCGGKVATALAALGRLGVSCSMISVIGDDPDGKVQIKDFTFNNVDTSHIIVDPSYDTRACVAIADRKSKSRFFLVCPRKYRRVRVEELNPKFIQQAKYLLLHYADQATAAAADWIHDSKGTVVFDADVYDKSIEEMLPKIDVFIASELYYKERYAGMDVMEACRLIRKQGPQTVIITLGSRGCVGCAVDGEFQLPSFSVDVVDTTGAGDVFHGGYIFGLLNNWSSEQCARWASAMSAIKCTSIGGRSGLPTREMVERFLKDGYIDKVEIENRVKRYAKMPYS